MIILQLADYPMAFRHINAYPIVVEPVVTKRCLSFVMQSQSKVTVMQFAVIHHQCHPGQDHNPVPHRVSTRKHFYPVPKQLSSRARNNNSRIARHIENRSLHGIGKIGQSLYIMQVNFKNARHIEGEWIKIKISVLWA
ncbi:MAG: hypothetical protein IAE84_07645 [Saprospiraceae bacterium]|nr:hypothetical protein [Saprospiraceae bacterium]